MKSHPSQILDNSLARLEFGDNVHQLEDSVSDTRYDHNEYPGLFDEGNTLNGDSKPDVTDKMLSSPLGIPSETMARLETHSRTAKFAHLLKLENLMHEATERIRNRDGQLVDLF